MNVKKRGRLSAGLSKAYDHLHQHAFERRDVPVIWFALIVFLIPVMVMIGWLHLQSPRVVSVESDRHTCPLDAFKVDINESSWPEIASLPHVGPTLARAIIEHRQSNGRYRSIGVLTEVPGIGEKKLAKMRPYLYEPIAR